MFEFANDPVGLEENDSKMAHQTLLSIQITLEQNDTTSFLSFWTVNVDDCFGKWKEIENKTAP